MVVVFVGNVWNGMELNMSNKIFFVFLSLSFKEAYASFSFCATPCVMHDCCNNLVCFYFIFMFRSYGKSCMLHCWNA